MPVLLYISRHKGNKDFNNIKRNQRCYCWQREIEFPVLKFKPATSKVPQGLSWTLMAKRSQEGGDGHKLLPLIHFLSFKKENRTQRFHCGIEKKNGSWAEGQKVGDWST